MNHLWKTPCLAKTMKIWLLRASQSLFRDGFQAWLLTTETGPDMLEGFKPLGWKGKRVGGGWAQGEGLQRQPVAVPILWGVPLFPFLHIPTTGQRRRRRSAEEAINSAELRFGQLTFKYASSSGERGSGFFSAQPVKDGVMLSRLLGNQQKVF